MNARRRVLARQVYLNGLMEQVWEAEQMLAVARERAEKAGVTVEELVAITDYAMGYEPCPYCAQREWHAAGCHLRKGSGK